MTILLVDDEPVFVRLLQLNLERNGFHVAAVASAAEAIAWLEEANGVELVITDQHLGGMSGLELFSALRNDLRWRRLPVILCTGAADRQTVEDAMRRGLHHFLVKPVRAAQLLEKVARATAEQAPVLQHRYDCMSRLGISEAEYKVLVRTSRDRLAALGGELAAARAARDHYAAREVVRRVREPADLVGAERCLLALAEFDAAPDPRWAVTAMGLVAQELATLLDAMAAALRPSVSRSGMADAATT